MILVISHLRTKVKSNSLKVEILKIAFEREFSVNVNSLTDH